MKINNLQKKIGLPLAYTAQLLQVELLAIYIDETLAFAAQRDG